MENIYKQLLEDEMFCEFSLDDLEEILEFALEDNED